MPNLCTNFVKVEGKNNLRTEELPLLVEELPFTELFFTLTLFDKTSFCRILSLCPLANWAFITLRALISSTEGDFLMSQQLWWNLLWAEMICRKLRKNEKSAL